MRVRSSMMVLSRAFGWALIVFGTGTLCPAIYSLATDFTTLTSFGGWRMTATMVVMTIEAFVALVLGLVVVFRHERFLLILGLWTGTFLAERVFRAIGWRWQGVWLFAAPCAFAMATYVVFKNRQALAASDANPRCSQCGYNLHGLAEPRCPECGRVYSLDEFYRL